MTCEAFDAMLEEYRSLPGWDGEGRPTVEKLRQLGIYEELVEAQAMAPRG